MISLNELKIETVFCKRPMQYCYKTNFFRIQFRAFCFSFSAF